MAGVWTGMAGAAGAAVRRAGAPAARAGCPAAWATAATASAGAAGRRLYSAAADDGLASKFLLRPLGSNHAPAATDNTGRDTRTEEEKKRDFTDYGKHLERRKQMLEEFSKSHFDEIYKYRANLGKDWVGPPSYFRADRALYMPNFFGRTLASSKPSGTTDVLRGKVSIVRVYTSVSGGAQAASYFESEAAAVGDEPADGGYQIVDINMPESAIKDGLVRLFEGNLRRTFGPARHSRYFIVRAGVSADLRRALGIGNKYTGYIYVVDRDCRVRWAACGAAIGPEREWMWKAVRGLVKERRRATM
ncbi:ATP10 protein-domain-containing protein [Dipodascopsis tothii]|uniref:ATP10 protein-domain-containing protein n=1 Tax=Dipodascopsis tothii TaxID=44089 RepID=UPI0034CF76CD